VDRHDVDWAGYIPAITTPFGDDGAILWDALAAQIDWLVGEGMHGIVLAGTTGEWFSLADSERERLFAEGGRAVGGRVPVLGGCAAFTPAGAIAHARAAEAAGLDGILLPPPPYVVPTRREVVRFYRDVAAATELPVCVYNWPRGCVVDLDVDVLAELAAIDGVVAIKNSTPDFAAFLEGMYALGDRVRYFGLPTNALGYDLASLGHGDGLMGAGGVLGADHPGFWDAVADGDRERALALGARDRVLMERWFGPDYGGRFGSAQAIMKAALRMRGVPAGTVRPPLLELEPAELAIVEATLRELGIEPVAAA
jgi:dihydrodipicolinate synthase/N-acetylneuraminate lyase